MNEQRGPDQGWKREDLHFVLDAEPPRYLEHVDGPVQYLAVADENETLGYLWFDDTMDAANFVFCAEAGTRARNARGSWLRELLTAKSHGLSPSQAMTAFAAVAGNARIGWIVPASLAMAEGVDAIETLARASKATSAD